MASLSFKALLHEILIFFVTWQSFSIIKLEKELQNRAENRLFHPLYRATTTVHRIQIVRSSLWDEITH